MKRYLLTIVLVLICAAALSGCGSPGDYIGGASNELTIATLHDNAFIEEAARRFEYMHDGRYTVNIVVYGDFASYAQIINTALMSGLGEDIINVSHIPWQRLADAGRLVDLNSKLSFTPGEFYQNILDAFLYNGGRYAIPLSFHMETFTLGDAASTSLNPNRFSIDDLLDLAGAYPDAHLMISPMGSYGTGLAYMFFNLDFAEFIDLANRQANVDSADFIRLLENVQSLNDRLRAPFQQENVLVIKDIFFNPAMSSGGMPDYTDFHIMTNNRGEGMVHAFDIQAINANSGNRELAARFLQFAISEEMQTSPEIWQTAINKNAAISNAIALYESIRAGGFTPPEYFCIYTNIAVFNRLAGRLTMAPTSDPFIIDFVRSEMTRFFDGEVTAQQAASNLQARLTTYLNE